MLCPAFRVYDNVVYIHFREMAHVVENHIHDPLECIRRVGETKWHDQPMEGTPFRLECGFMDIFRVYANLIEYVSLIHLRKETRVLHAADGGIHARYWIYILDGYGTKPAIIHTKTQSLVVFLDEEQASAEGRLGSFDTAACE